MPYRSIAHVPPRVLVLRNHSMSAAVLTSGMGFFFTAAGVVVMPMTGLFALPGTEVVTSAMGTVFLLVGITITTLAIRMRRSQTVFALDRAQLTVTVETGSGPSRHHVLPVGDIELVGVDDDPRDGTYRAHIVLRDQGLIALGEGRSRSREHYESMASSVRAFLFA